MTATLTVGVSKPFFLIVENFSLRSRNLDVKRFGSVLEIGHRAFSPRVITSGGEDNKKKLVAACFSVSCGLASKLSVLLLRGNMLYNIHRIAGVFAELRYL